MSWNDVSLKMYYQLCDAIAESENEMDMALGIMRVLYNKDYEKAPIQEYYDKLEEIRFLNEEIPYEKVGKSTTINGHKYKIRYDIGKMPADIVFSSFKALNSDISKNLHYVIYMALEGEYDDAVRLNDSMDIDMVTAQSILKKMNDKCDENIEDNVDMEVRKGIAEILTLKMPFREKLKITKELFKTYNIYLRKKGAE